MSEEQVVPETRGSRWNYWPQLISDLSLKEWKVDNSGCGR